MRKNGMFVDPALEKDRFSFDVETDDGEEKNDRDFEVSQKAFRERRGLVPKRVTVHREGKTFQRTQMVRPDEVDEGRDKYKKSVYAASFDLSPPLKMKFHKKILNLESRVRPNLCAVVEAMECPLTSHPDLEEMRGKTPPGWQGTGMTWDDVDGCYSRTDKKVYFSYSKTGNSGSVDTLIHEFGHGVYWRLNTTEKDDFHKIYKNYKRFLPEYEAANPSEYFAEAFARWVTGEVGQYSEFHNDHDPCLLPNELKGFFERLKE